jgi:hypothetical protein
VNDGDYTLPAAASIEWPHTRAQRLAWLRYEPTPIFAATVHALGYPSLLDETAS